MDRINRPSVHFTRLVAGCLTLLAALGVLAACGGPEPTATPVPTAAPQEPAAPTAAKGWEAEWDRVLAAAKQEGKLQVTAYSAPQRRGYEGFQKAHPDIQVEVGVIPSREAAQRIPLERKAGIYNFDVYNSGASPTLDDMELVQGMFDDINKALILPDLAKDETWVGDFNDWWMDDTHQKYLRVFGGTIGARTSLWINTEKVPEGTLRDWTDLMKPEFKGKIVMQDFRTAGGADKFVASLLLSYGEDFVRKLMTEQEVVISNDLKAYAEDTIRGRYYIAYQGQFEEFHTQGVGLHVKQMRLPFTYTDESRQLVSLNCCGAGRQNKAAPQLIEFSDGNPIYQVSMFQNAPNPNAAKVYVNWVLSRDGMKQWFEALDSRRPYVRYCTARADLADLRTDRDCGGKFDESGSYYSFERNSNRKIAQLGVQIGLDIFGR